jgi:DNA-binding NarL/FixJ family response regulator
MKKTIYIVDDNPYMREVLVMLVEEEEDLEVCGIAETATEALRTLCDLDADLVIADLSMPEMNGIEFIERLCQLKPQLRATILSARTETGYAEQALVAGAKGYFLKGDPMAIMEGIRRVLDGEIYVSSSMCTPALRKSTFNQVEPRA